MTVFSLTLVFAIGVSCGDDDKETTDKGVTLSDSGTTQQDTGGTTQQDTGGTTQQDTGSTMDPDTGAESQDSPNSGQTCDASNPCPLGDTCLLLQGWDQTKGGMCFGSCAAQGEMCNTPNPNTVAACALSDEAQTNFFCLYICEAQGQSFPCPDPATQECVDSGQEGIKICRPNQS